MEARILGAHQCETLNQRFTTILVDGRLAIDAGSLAGGLGLEAQLAVSDVLLTHQHWDHTKDLSGFGFNLLGAHQTVLIHCTEEVRRVVESQLLSPTHWIDFFLGPDPSRPVFRQERVDVGTEFPVGPYRVLSVPVNHSVPTTGYQVTDRAGRKLFYTGDNGPGCGRYWLAAQPDVLVTECTYSNVAAEEAARHGHLCPSALEAALAVFRADRGYLPRVILVHLNPFHEERIAIEAAEVARRLNASIELGREDLTVTV